MTNYTCIYGRLCMWCFYILPHSILWKNFISLKSNGISSIQANALFSMEDFACDAFLFFHIPYCGRTLSLLKSNGISSMLMHFLWKTLHAMHLYSSTFHIVEELYLFKIKWNIFHTSWCTFHGRLCMWCFYILPHSISWDNFISCWYTFLECSKCTKCTSVTIFWDKAFFHNLIFPLKMNSMNMLVWKFMLPIFLNFFPGVNILRQSTNSSGTVFSDTWNSTRLNSK